MIHSQRTLIGVVLLVGFYVLTAGPANAGEPRTRTLKYDAENKEWIELPPPPPGTAEGDLHLIRVRIKQEEYRGALRGIKQFLEKYGDGDPLYPELMIANAEVLIGRRDYYKAHLLLQEFLDRFAGAAMEPEALRLEYVIAETYLTGVKRKWLGVRFLSGEDLAYRILDEISIDYADSRFAELAFKTKGDHMFQKGKHALAELEYSQLLKEFPQSRYHQFALRRSAEAALADYGGLEYDETALIEAQERYRDYHVAYPGAADREGVGLILASINEQRAVKAHAIGSYYERTNHPATAIFYYQHVIEKWPDTVGATKAASCLEMLGVGEPGGLGDSSRLDG